MVTSYGAVVYDLDGTLMRLAVDWQETAEEIKPILGEHGETLDANEALNLVPIAEEIGAMEDIESHIAATEREGARNSERLPDMDELVKANVPVGICSLNCEAACREALNAHGISNEIGAIVGRNSVENRKPHPEPLLTAVGRLGTEPEKTLFVGDSDSDAETARRAGTAFRRE